MSKDHRRNYHRAWAQLTPPVRPNSEVVKAITDQIGPSPGRTLLLGVTPELADIASDVVALDRNITMVSNIWPGNSATRRAVVGDWRNTNFISRSFSACVGDGCLGALRFPDEYALLFSEVNRILQSAGKFACRFFAPPNTPEDVSEVRDAALSRTIGNFHAFKFRLGMALAARRPGYAICVDAIFKAFSELFADRAELARTTGWERSHIDTIDFYRDSTVHYHFPPRELVLRIAADTFSAPRLISSGVYEMAELCPLLVAESRGR